MMQEAGRRIATSDGAMLADPKRLGNLLDTAGDAIFEPQYWAQRGELGEVVGGRGSAWFVGAAERAWALRHSRRGGFIARFVHDRYVWAGEPRVRAFAEWRLLLHLSQARLPVPVPVAARYQRRGLTYRCDLITQRITDAESVAVLLARAEVPERVWREMGVSIARLHAAGADHADLNAHNILIGRAGVSVIDFDRGKLRPAGAWQRRNLARLHRSLSKIKPRFNGWQWLLAGYASV